MKFMSRVKLLFTPQEPEDAVNKKYVDEQAAQIDTSDASPHDMLTVNEYYRIVSTHIPFEDLVYGSDEDFINTVVERSDIINADLFNGYTFMQTIQIAVQAVGLPNVTNDRQVKALKTVRAGNIAIWGADGSILKDSGFTIEKSVPADAVFTDHIYEEATDTQAGLISAELNNKLKQLDIYRQLFFFESVDVMKNHDMSGYPHSYAYGVVGTTQYRYRADNTEDPVTGKWRVANELIGDLIDFSNFQIDFDGYMSVLVSQKDVSGNVLNVSRESIGKAGISPQGQWESGKLYTYMNMVYHDGQLFMCVADKDNSTMPGTDEQVWMTCSMKAQDNYDLYLKFTDDEPPMTFDEWQKENKGKDGESGSLITDIVTNDMDETVIVVETPYFDEYGNRQTKEDRYNVGKIQGLSAYDIAVNHGFDGTEDEWLKSLGGNKVAEGLAVKRNINGILFDGTADVRNFTICTTDTDIQVKELQVNNMVLDNALLYVYFPEGNECDTIRIKINDSNAMNVYYQNSIFNARLIVPGTVLALICLQSGEFIVTGIDSTDNIKKIIGDMQELVTEDKGTIVGALNEIASNVKNITQDFTKQIDSINGIIGDINTLPTKDKSSLVAAMQEVFQLGCDFKKRVSAAITAKDNNVLIYDPEHATVNDFVSAIGRIKTDSSTGTGGAGEMRNIYSSDNVEYDTNNVMLEIDSNAQYTAMRTLFGTEKKLMFRKQVEAMMLGRYSLIIRAKSSMICQENVMEIHIYKPEIPLIHQSQETLQRAYIRGMWFDKADKYKVFGLTFDIDVKNTMQVTIECYACGINGANAGDGVSVDYAMVNNAFTAIGSLT